MRDWSLKIYRRPVKPWNGPMESRTQKAEEVDVLGTVVAEKVENFIVVEDKGLDEALVILSHKSKEIKTSIQGDRDK